jgi:predicted DNA-binding transcriptional regulator AlpA
MRRSTPDTSTTRGGRTAKTSKGVSHVVPDAAGILPALLTTQQTAELCGVGERTFWAWSRSGLAPAPIKIGHGLRPAVRYRRSEIMAWITAGCPRCDGGQRL